MERHEIEALFDRTATSYDQQWAKLAPLREALYLLSDAVLTELRDETRILCVGVGTGSELIDLARQHPNWHFTAVEPSASMMEVCRSKAEAAGIAVRCVFHVGYLESLPPTEAFDAATALLVSQFILDRTARSAFFGAMAQRLRPGGLLISSDLAGDTTSPTYRRLLDVWWQVMRTTNASLEGLERMRVAYERDVAVLPPDDVSAIIAAGGFEAPTLFLQTGLIHAWFSRRAA